MHQTLSKFKKCFIFCRSKFVMAFDFQNTNNQTIEINGFGSYFVCFEIWSLLREGIKQKCLKMHFGKYLKLRRV